MANAVADNSMAPESRIARMARSIFNWRNLPRYSLNTIVGAVCGSAFALLLLATVVSVFQPAQGRRDFVVFWATGQQLVHHANPYDCAALLKMERDAQMPVVFGAMYMRNLPFALPIVYWLGFMNIGAASLCWSSLLLTCFLASVYMLWKMYGGGKILRLWIGYAFAPAWYCLLTGQSAHLALFGLVVFLRWHRTRPFLAGMALWLCILKPQLFLPFGAALIAWLVMTKGYRVVAGFMTTVFASVGVTYLIDPQAWTQYAQMMHRSGIQTEFIPCLSSTFRVFIHGDWLWLQYAPALAACVWAVYYFRSHRQSWEWAKHHGGLVMLVSLLCAPYGWIYDAGVALPALIYGAFTTRSKSALIGLALLNAYVEFALFTHMHVMKVFYDWTIWCALAWAAWYLLARRLKEDTNRLACPARHRNHASLLAEARMDFPQLFCVSDWLRQCWPALTILFVAFWAVVPLLVLGPSNGDDLAFHLMGWIDAKHAWQQGVLYPHWAPSAAFSAGEPRFVFYPPLSWMLGAALGFVLSWKLVSPAFIFIILSATGLATYRLAREVMDRRPAVLAGCIALTSGYSLYATYARSAFGEIFGGFWIPLLLLLLGRLITTKHYRLGMRDTTAHLLSLVFAGIFLSNIPLSIMACYFAVAAAVLFSWSARSCSPILRVLQAMATAMALCGFYLAPLIWERQWINAEAIHGNPMLQLEYRMFDPRILGEQIAHRYVDPKLYAAAFAMILVSVISSLACWRRGLFYDRKMWWSMLVLVAPVILVLQFPFSLPLWRLIPALHLLQFPWRLLVLLEAPMSVLLVAAVLQYKGLLTRRRLWIRRGALAACTTVFSLAILFAGFFFYRVDPVPGGLTFVTLALHQYRIGIAPAAEYTPLGAHDELLNWGLPDSCVAENAYQKLAPPYTECEKYVAFSSQGEGMTLQTSFDHSAFIILRQRYYPAWQVMLNGREATNLIRRADGLIAVPINPGPVNISIEWKTTGDVILGRLISICACLSLAVCGWLGLPRALRRKEHIDAAIAEPQRA